MLYKKLFLLTLVGVGTVSGKEIARFFQFVGGLSLVKHERDIRGLRRDITQLKEDVRILKSNESLQREYKSAAASATDPRDLIPESAKIDAYKFQRSDRNSPASASAAQHADAALHLLSDLPHPALHCLNVTTPLPARPAPITPASSATREGAPLSPTSALGGAPHRVPFGSELSSWPKDGGHGGMTSATAGEQEPDSLSRASQGFAAAQERRKRSQQKLTARSRRTVNDVRGSEKTSLPTAESEDDDAESTLDILRRQVMTLDINHTNTVGRLSALEERLSPNTIHTILDLAHAIQSGDGVGIEEGAFIAAMAQMHSNPTFVKNVADAIKDHTEQEKKSTHAETKARVKRKQGSRASKPTHLDVPSASLASRAGSPKPAAEHSRTSSAASAASEQEGLSSAAEPGSAQLDASPDSASPAPQAAEATVRFRKTPISTGRWGDYPGVGDQA